MNDNSVKVDDNTDFYENQIYYYADQYIDSLPDSNDIYNSNTFDGMIAYIYKHVFKPKKGIKYNNKYNTHNTILDTDDIETLDNIFYTLADLCSKYKKHITILQFCDLIGINNTTISEWANGNNRVINDNRASSGHSETAKKWLSFCEKSLVSGAVNDNSVGCIFALKANYGYSDQPVQKIEITNGKTDPGEIAADIASRHIESNPERPSLLGDIDILDN